MKWLNAKNIRLASVFLAQDLRGRYVGSTMGIFWNIINPLVTISLYTLIFQVILKQKSSDHPYYVAYIFCGILPWMAVSEALVRCTGTILENANLVKKVVFPKEILIINVVLSSFIHELIGLVLFIILLFVLGTPPGIFASLIIIVFMVQLIFSAGLGFLFSTLNVFIRDTLPLLGATLSLWFFLTPIVYPAEAVPARFMKYFELNPLYLLVKMYRSLLLKNQWLDPRDLLIFSILTCVIFVAGLIYFRRNKQEFADFI
jgi:lipopolysaccharide transport system permease protein